MTLVNHFLTKISFTLLGKLLTGKVLRHNLVISRELKSLGEKEKEHRYAVCQNLGRQNLEKRAMSEIEANFKTLSKNLLNIGQGIYSSREVRELFVNVVDKVVEPLKQWKLSPEEVSLLMSAYLGVVVEGTIQLEPLLKSSFQRFMNTITVIITTFHR